VGFITFAGKPLGQRISTAEAEDHIFGLVLFNDWSARDIQAWEYVPWALSSAKNFAQQHQPLGGDCLDALEPFRVPGPVQDPQRCCPTCSFEGDRTSTCAWKPWPSPLRGEGNTVICRSNFKHLYWNMAQQLAHHTVNGCNVRCGDLMASGTISGPTIRTSYGSMLELTWRGTKPLILHDGSTNASSSRMATRWSCAAIAKRRGAHRFR
jgi:fumarylacetoacetase